VRDDFPGDGTHLARYGARLPAVEINSSFYQHHRHSQYAKWAGEVAADFRFAVKLPRWLTHDQRLRSTEGLDDFLAEVAGLGHKLGPLLVQLPPSLAFEAEAVEAFLETLRARFSGAVVIEPRHASWFEPAVTERLTRHEISRVSADPPPVAGAHEPAGWPGRLYWRLHGRPRKFYSAYGAADLADLDARLRAVPDDTEAWCIFNNTATEAGLVNATDLAGRLARRE